MTIPVPLHFLLRRLGRKPQAFWLGFLLFLEVAKRMCIRKYIPQGHKRRKAQTFLWHSMSFTWYYTCNEIRGQTSRDSASVQKVRVLNMSWIVSRAITKLKITILYKSWFSLPSNRYQDGNLMVCYDFDSYITTSMPSFFLVASETCFQISNHSALPFFLLHWLHPMLPRN